MPSRSDTAPAVAVTTHGSPAAMASSKAMGSPSQRELRTNASNAGHRRATSSRSPKNTTLPPRGRAWTSRRGRSGPSPTMTRSMDRWHRARAPRRSSKAFWGTKRATVAKTQLSPPSPIPSAWRASAREPCEKCWGSMGFSRWVARARATKPRATRSSKSGADTETTCVAAPHAIFSAIKNVFWARTPRPGLL